MINLERDKDKESCVPVDIPNISSDETEAYWPLHDETDLVVPDGQLQKPKRC